MLRIGTDCSGIEAPIQALINLKHPYRHVFSSDISPYCIQSIKANYSPERIYGDITKRDSCTLPDFDLYVCGFPCQPFSHAGKRKGLQDSRGTIFRICIDVIKTKQPKYFVLENVKGLLNHDKGNTRKVIYDELKELITLGYKVDWKVLNTRDYGIPQNRERVYIVGTKGDFSWPSPVSLHKHLSEYVDDTNKKRREPPNFIKEANLLNIIPAYSVFIDFGFRYFTHPNADRYSPCITASHAKDLWCVKHSRYATVNELLSLQGFSMSFKQVVSDSQLKKQIGNSMSVNVLESIFKNLLC